MAKRDLKVIGISVSLTYLGVISLALFIKSIGILFESWFRDNALVIAISSGVVVLFLIITGAISLGALKGRNVFSP